MEAVGNGKTDKLLFVICRNDIPINSQPANARAVRQLATHYSKAPDQITEEELRNYFLYLKNEKKASHSASTIALCGIKFFFEQTLQWDWQTFDLVRPPKSKKLPVVLSQDEVRQVL